MSSEDPTLRISRPTDTAPTEGKPTTEGQSANPGNRPTASDLENLPTVVTPSASGSPTATMNPSGISAAGTGSVSAELEMGSRVANRYRIENVLGVGGMGIVYRAMDEVLSVPLALKVLRPEIAQDSEFLERFRNELVLARQVTHRNVVRIHDIGEHHGMSFMTMDLVDGRSLQSLIKERGKLSLETTVDIVRQIASALDEAHRQEVVHRDLKPANILIDAKGQAYVTDFGVARSLAGSGMTRTGEVLGTPDYLSPEQAKGEKVDGRSDLYTLGLMFVEMLSGKLPFPGGTVFEILAQRISGNMRSLDELGVDVPEPYVEVIERCVAKEASERYQTAAELVAALDAVQNPSHRTRRQERQQRIGIMAVAGLLALLAGVFLLPRLLSPPDPDASAAESNASAAADPAEVTPELPPVPAMGDVRHTVAVLPLAAEDDDLWAAYGLAQGISNGLAASPVLRVTDAEGVAKGLHDLGLSSDRLRDDQLRRLLDLFAVDRLVLGNLETGNGDWAPSLEVVSLEDGQLLRNTVDVSSSPGAESLEVLQSHLSRSVALHLGTPLPDEDSPHASLPGSFEAAQSYGEGWQRLATGDRQGAVDAWTQTSQQAPTFAPAWLRQAQTYQQLGQQSEALDAAREAVRLTDETSPVGLEARATEALLRGRPDEATEHLQSWIEAQPNVARSRVRQAEAYGQLGQLDHALAHLDAAVELDPSHPEAWYFRGRFAIGLGETRRAVDEDLLRALTLYRNLKDAPGQALVLNALGVGHQRLGELDPAIERYQAAADIRRSIDDRPGLASTLHNLVWMYLSRGDLTEAEATIKQALDIQEALENPRGAAELYNAYGMLEEVRGSFSKALDQFRRALQLRDDLGLEAALAESHNNVGFSYFMLGEYDNARLYLEKALALHRENDEPRGILLVQQNLGFCQLAQGEWDASQTTFDNALGLARELGEKTAIAVSQGNLARLAFAQGRFRDAVSLYGEALDILAELGNPSGQVEFSLDLASLHLELGDVEAAQAALDAVEGWLDAVDNQEQRARYQAARGWFQLRSGDAAQARQAFNQALRYGEQSDAPTAAIEAQLGVGVLGDDALLEQAWQDAERLGHAHLRLQASEALAAAEIRRGEPSAAKDRLRDAVRLAEERQYRRTYRLYELLANAQDGLGEADAAERSRRSATEHKERLRDQLDEAQWNGLETSEALLSAGI